MDARTWAELLSRFVALPQQDWLLTSSATSVWSCIMLVKSAKCTVADWKITLEKIVASLNNDKSQKLAYTYHVSSMPPVKL
jgi:hypothetical protein